MNLVALSRANIEGNRYYFEGPKSVAICIAYPTGRLHAIMPGGTLLDVLHLRFSDCDGEGRWCFPDRKDPDIRPLPMDAYQAKVVVDFVEKWKAQVEVVYAACYGGVSRSRGILAGLAAAYGWDDRELYAFGQPNAWCKTLIVREAAARRNP